MGEMFILQIFCPILINDYTEDMATFTALAKIHSSEYFCNAKIFGYTVTEFIIMHKFQKSGLNAIVYSIMQTLTQICMWKGKSQIIVCIII